MNVPATIPAEDLERRLKYYGLLPDEHGETPGLLPPGVLVLYAGGRPPAGWLVADGRAYQKEHVPGLYKALGGMYNLASDPPDVVRLPDLRSVLPKGALARFIIKS